MNIILIIAAFILGLVIGYIVVAIHFALSNDLTLDDPTGDKKQKLFDTLTKLKKDIESTV